MQHTMTGLPHFKMIAAQIDLNRQKEPMTAIRTYIDCLADNGYNTLVLYIAWRVKIDSHPWPSEAEAYTADEIREIVALARGRGLAVVPTTNLTYVPSLLKYDAMKKYLENGTRFWGAPRGNFCASNPEVYPFIEAYLTEMARLIPSDYFHIGGDETWDIGCCARCQGDACSFQKEQDLYLTFILRAYDVVRNKLGRRMIMWDDMFEYYPDALDKIPRDVIMAHWQYQPDCYRSMSHFGNHKRERTLAKYDDMGFSYLLAPATYSTSNGRTLTAGAWDGRNLMGGIMTVWGTHLKFMYKDLPTIASVGRYWEQRGAKDEAACFREALSSLLGTADERLIDAIRCYTEIPYRSFTAHLSENSLLTFNFDGLDFPAKARNTLLAGIIEAALEKTSRTIGTSILDEINLCLQVELAAFAFKRALHAAVYQGRREGGEMRRHLDVVRRLADAYSAKWEQWRPGIHPNCIRQTFDQLIAGLEKLIAQAERGDFVKILFCLPNGYGAMQSRIMIDDGHGETLLAQGVFKSSPIGAGFFERVFYLDRQVVPRVVRIETRGYGGQGVAHVSAEIAGAALAPAKVTARGQVVNSEFILDDDCKTCWMGEPDADKAWRNRAVADAVSTVEIELTRCGNQEQS